MRGIWRRTDLRCGWWSGICMMLLVSIDGTAEEDATPTEQPVTESVTPQGSYTFRLDSERSDPIQVP